jgi:predicted extracellular nuclease
MIARRLEQLLVLILTATLVALGGCSAPPSSSGDDAALEADTGVDAAREAAQITIATFNVRRFFDTECDSNRCGPNDWEEQLSENGFNNRLDKLSAAIDDLDADVVLLQEIEKQSVLDALAAKFDGEYPVSELGEIGNVASVDVGVLARGTLVDTKGYRDSSDLQRPDGSHTRFAREFLRVDLDIDGERVIVFTAHFVSKASDDAGRRLAEAQEARRILDEVAAQNDDALVVLGGDLNDTPDSEPMAALTDDGGLLRVGADQSLEDVFTYVWNWEQEAIDHLLLASTSGGAYVDGSARSVHDRQPAGLGGSDHGALVATFEMR